MRIYKKSWRSNLKIVLKVGQSRADWWKDHMVDLLPEHEIFLSDEVIDEDSIDLAIVWLPEEGWLRTFPNLKCIFTCVYRMHYNTKNYSGISLAISNIFIQQN